MPTTITTQQTQAQPQTLPPITPDNFQVPLGQLGIWGALIFFIAKEGWGLIARQQEARTTAYLRQQEAQTTQVLQKDAAESKLIADLVNSLKENQQSLLTQLMSLQKQSGEDIRELKSAVMSLATGTREEVRAALNTQTDAIVRQSQLYAQKAEILSNLERKIDGLHIRFNRIEQVAQHYISTAGNRPFVDREGETSLPSIHPLP